MKGMSAEPPHDRVDRDRDARGRPRNARPRDALGRPLAYDAYDAEEADQVADSPAGPPADSLRRAQLLLDAGRPFQAHEVLEDAWKAAPAAERELWRGLAQLAVGLTHAARGNRTGAAALISRGAANLAGYAGGHPARPPHGVDVAGLQAWAAAAAAAMAGPATGTAPLGPPRLTLS
ncbi:MAG: uncharacterized protein QOE53_2664 [Pseudonocardiales bacterium]|jgi:hypothetical protein|nr:uncharacterized protein [Pseudonocardiales bacterium]